MSERDPGETYIPFYLKKNGPVCLWQKSLKSDLSDKQIQQILKRDDLVDASKIPDVLIGETILFNGKGENKI